MPEPGAPTQSPLAGQPVPPERLVDLAALERAYYDRSPNPDDPLQQVSFGTSGHRGSSLTTSFNEAHILAITQAICDYRKRERTDGPLYLGRDTHALSEPALRTALEVLAANGVETVVERDAPATPTPAVSHAILAWNRGRTRRLADGIVVTPSHNPPEDGGFKYNPPNGGPADTDVTRAIQDRANQLLRRGNDEVLRLPAERALAAPTTHRQDLVKPYVDDLQQAVDMEAIRTSGIRVGVDPLGGAGLPLWQPIAEAYGVDLVVTNPALDPRFAFMTLDHDGKIRTDCSSPYAMARLVALKDRYPIAFGNDGDADRHGVVTPSTGLMNPNHYLAVAIRYLLTNRPGWRADAAVGKTLVTSRLVDRVVEACGRKLLEVPVGFKWFVPGLLDGSLCFGGEESAGASFLRRDGNVWTTDKDGIVLGLLAAEITARSGKDPGEHLRELLAEFGTPYYRRIDAPASAEERARLQRLQPSDVRATHLAGEEILARLTHAPGNGASIGGLKVVTASGWFAARPSGTENIYKIYAESLRDEAHLQAILGEAGEIVREALGAG
jgi:phosphoglucomutase